MLRGQYMGYKSSEHMFPKILGKAFGFSRGSKGGLLGSRPGGPWVSVKVPRRLLGGPCGVLGRFLGVLGWGFLGGGPWVVTEDRSLWVTGMSL